MIKDHIFQQKPISCAVLPQPMTNSSWEDEDELQTPTVEEQNFPDSNKVSRKSPPATKGDTGKKLTQSIFTHQHLMHLPSTVVNNLTALYTIVHLKRHCKKIVH